MRKALAVTATAAVLATGLAGAGYGVAPAAATASGTGPATSAAAPPGTVSWGRCPAIYPASLQCGTVKVPVDYRAPAGPKISLAVSRVKATGTAAQRQGVLLVNPGGPGGTGVGFALAVQSWLPAKVKAAYDVIGFDPRGVGRSGPVRCVGSTYFAAPMPDPVPTSDADLAAGADRARQYAAGCLSRNGAAIKHLNTRNTVHDMDMIRAALGEKKINFVGYSYGTYLGATYATLYPHRVRRFLLDSNVDPTGIWYRANLDQNVAFESAFRRFIAYVAANDRTYRLGDTTGEVRSAYNRMRAELSASPIDGFGAAELDSFMLGAMYGDVAWALYAEVIRMYLAGEREFFEGDPVPISAANENSIAAYTAVSCNDAPFPHDLGTWFGHAESQYRSHPFAVWYNTSFTLPCAFWPNQNLPAPKVGRAGLPGILLVHSVGDAATPYVGGLKMQRALPGSRMVTVTRNGNHGQFLFEGNACVDAYGADYLVTGRLPARDVSCVGAATPAPADWGLGIRAGLSAAGRSAADGAADGPAGGGAAGGRATALVQTALGEALAGGSGGAAAPGDRDELYSRDHWRPAPPR